MKPTINVFSGNGDLGTSFVTEQQPLIPSNYTKLDETDVIEEQIIAEEQTLAEKQFLAEQQLVLNKKSKRTRTVVDQQSFSKETLRVKNKLVNTQLPTNEPQIAPDEHMKPASLKSERKSIPDSRVSQVLNDTHRQSLTKVGD